MEAWKERLSEDELNTIESIPSHEGYYTYSDKQGTHYLIKDGEVVRQGKEIEVFSSGDYAITTNYDTWSLYRGDELLCEGVWVLSHNDQSYTFKYYNDTIGKYIIEKVSPNGKKQDEIELTDNIGHNRIDYMNFV